MFSSPPPAQFSSGGDLLISADDRSGIGYELWKLNNIPDRDTDTEITSISPFPVTTGETFSVEVTVQTGDGGDPTGVVDVGDATGNNCQITLVGGVGSCDLTLTELGLHTIYARYTWGTEYLSSSDEDFQGVAPHPPASIDASYKGVSDSIIISWDPVVGATFYKLYRSESEFGVQTEVYSGTDTIFPDYGVAYQDYYYWVRACYDVVCSDETGYAIGARLDTIKPTGSFKTPLQSGKLSLPRGLVKVNAFDGETGVANVTFEVRHNGSLLYTSVDSNGADGWQHTFSTNSLPTYNLEIIALIVDQDGNDLPITVNGISLTSTVTNAQGYEARGRQDIHAEAGQYPTQQNIHLTGPRFNRQLRYILME